MQEIDKAAAFEADLLSRLDEAQGVTGYGFKGIRKLIKERGGVRAALHLLDLSKINMRPEGFRVLCENSLLQNSLEQTVIDWAESALFPAVIIKSAKARLLLARMMAAKNHRAGL